MQPLFGLPSPLNALLRSHKRCGAMSAALAVLCYWNSLRCGLVHDDIFAIRDNSDIRPKTPLSRVFSDDFWGKPMTSNVSHKSYRPLTILSFRLNYSLHGLDPWGYHLVNVFLHVLATLVVGWMTRKLVFPEPHLTFLVMCLFASHPVHSEAVTGVVGRAELLSCICFLLSLISFTSSLSQTSIRQSLGVCVSMILGGMAMFFKETGATVFGMCLLYDLMIHSNQIIHKVFIRRKEDVFPSLVPFLLRSSSLLLCSSFLLYLRVSLLHGVLPHFSDHDNPASHSSSLLTRSLTYSYLFFFNTRLLVYPLTLCYDWQMGSIPLVESLTDTRNLWTILFFSFFFSLCFLSSGDTQATGMLFKSGHVVFLSLLLMVIPFLPASNLLFRVGFVVAERILYIPSIGYCILVAQGIKTLSTRLHFSPPPGSRLPLIFFILSLVLVGLFSVRTIVRNPVWQTRESLFKSGLVTVPHNAKIHYNYANYLSDSERFEEAAHHYRLALKLAPDHVSSHNNLANLPVVERKEAEFHFRQAVHYNPTHYKAFYNLGNNLLIKGDYYGSLMSLATIMSESGRGQDGLRLMREAVGVAPNDPLVRNNMASFLIRQGEVREAIEEYQYSLSLDPSQPAVMNNLARAYRSQGDNQNAEKWFLRSLEANEDVSTYSSLGALYFNTGSFSKAKQTFSRALSLQPLHLQSQCSYLQSMIQLGETRAAESEARSVLNHYSDPHCLHLILTTLYSKNNQTLDKAIHHSREAQKSQDPQEATEASLILAGIQKTMGQMDEAEKSYRRAVTLSPGMVNAHMNLGALLHLRKKYSEARLYYEKALSLDPGNKLVTENLSKLNKADAK